MANEVHNFNIDGVDHEVMDQSARSAITALQTALNTLTQNSDSQNIINTFNEIVAYLEGIKTNDPNLASTIAGLQQSITTLQGAISGKVDKVTGKGLSTEDYTTNEKNKLAGIAAGAEVNTIEGIIVNGTEVTPDSTTKKVSISAVAGDDGVTPHIGLNGNWYIGDTDTGVKAQGPTGNVTVSDGVAEIDIVNDLTTGGAGDALSAEMGKQLGASVDELEEAVEDVEQGAYDISVVGDAIVINSRSNPRVTVGSVGNNSLSAKAGNTATTSFYVSGRNLTDAIQIAVSDSTNWAVDIQSISPTNGKVAQTLVTITYQPASGTTAGTTQNCTVTISSTGATSSTIAMTGTVVAAPTITLTLSSDTITTPSGTSGTTTLNVKGAALEGDISLAISGTGFTLSADTVAQADAESSAGADIIVTFDGTSAGSATITASSTNATSVTTMVYGTLQAVFNATTGYVVKNDGSVAAESGGFYTDTIQVGAGQVLKFYGYIGANFAAIFKEESGTKTKLVSGSGSSTRTEYSYTATESCNLGVCNYRTNGDEAATLDGVNVAIVFPNNNS